MKRKRRIVSVLMASMMLFSICGVPGYAGTDGIEPEEGGSVVTEKEPLPEKGKLTEYEEVSKTDKEAGESENVRSTDVEPARPASPVGPTGRTAPKAVILPPGAADPLFLPTPPEEQGDQW